MLVALALGAGAIAQRTWVVDVFGRGDFTDLPPAFAAAAPGDTIEVRNPSGNRYSAVTTSKGVNVVSAPYWGQRIPITVVDLPVGQSLRIMGLKGAHDLRLHRCQGAVHLHELSYEGLGLGTLEIVDCRLVTVNFSWVTNLVALNSTVLLCDSVFDGWTDVYPFGTMAYPAVRMVDSDVTASECKFRGATAYPTGPWPSIPAIQMVRGRLKFAGTSFSFAQGGHTRWFSPPSVLLGPGIESYDGLVVVDPDVRLAPLDGQPFTGTSRLIREQIPFVSLQHIYPGQPLDCGPAPTWRCPILDALPGTSAAICVSLPSAPLPTPFGDLWLDPFFGTTMLVTLGTVDATGKLRGTIDLTRVLRPGDATLWQAVLIGPQGELSLSNPTVPVLGVY